MGNKNQRYKKVLFSVLLIGMTLPLIQSNLDLFEELELEGYYVEKEAPQFNREEWFSQEYQKKKQEYVEENFGFRNFFVKLNNQLCFSLFNYSRTQNVVIGKENYLFDDSYIDSYLGRDFVGENLIKRKVEKLSVVRDSLAKKNIDLMVVIAPGKANYFPEFIPDKYNSETKSTTNYEIYVSEFKKKGIHLIDFNAYFIQNKGKTQHPLYSKGGIHWSNYGELLAGDSIIKYIERIRNIQLPHMNVQNVVVSDSAQKTDNDVESGMNLLFDLNKENLAYPSTDFIKTDNTKSVKTLVIGDSFYWGLFNQAFSNEVFDDGQFWYYNMQRFQPSLGQLKEVPLVDTKEEIEKHEMVVILLTEANLFKFAYGFVDESYKRYVKLTSSSVEEKIQAYITTILRDPGWVEKIRGYAIEDGVSFEEKLRGNAEYMVMMDARKESENKEE